MNDWFDERYIKKIPIEEQIRGQVRAQCYYMDKADIYEWITQNEIKIMNLQEENERLSVELNKNMIERNNYLSRNEKAIEYINTHYLNANEPELLNILNGGDDNE